jgi:FSR family fosmidomycin resistance protein-like MFS transporter
VIGLVGLAHMISHFSQLLLAPLFPWLKDDFNASYAELGFLMTMFFVVSCAVQDVGLRGRPLRPAAHSVRRPGLLGVAAFGLFDQHQLLDAGRLSVLAGIGNGVFHPVDYTLLNRKVSSAAPGPRLQRARHHRQPGLGAGAGHAGAD